MLLSVYDKGFTATKCKFVERATSLSRRAEFGPTVMGVANGLGGGVAPAEPQQPAAALAWREKASEGAAGGIAKRAAGG
jgi:hypothetical protein